MTPARELHVTAAGAYEHVLDEIAPVFGQEFGLDVRLAIANAAGVIKRLETKQPVDVVLTSAAGIAHLVAAGLADGASQVEVGRMRLGLAARPGVPVPALTSVESFQSAVLAAPRVAFIDPKGGGTSGPFIEKLFERLGVLDRMTEHGILCKTGKDVVRAVASGQADLGLTQASELIGAKGVEFAGFLPDDVQVVSVYSGAVATHSRLPDQAIDFLRFMKSSRSVERFRSTGWDAAG